MRPKRLAQFDPKYPEASGSWWKAGLVRVAAWKPNDNKGLVTIPGFGFRSILPVWARRNLDNAGCHNYGIGIAVPGNFGHRIASDERPFVLYDNVPIGQKYVVNMH